MRTNKAVTILTLGCRVNQYESCAIAERLRNCGFVVKKGDCSDYYIVNTCAVTAESERKSRQLVRRCAAKGKVLVVGCASQLSQTFAELENVIYVGGNRNKMAVVDAICRDTEMSPISVLPMDGAPYEEMCLSGKEELFSECRAFIKIQDGCNGKCTYCIIPKCRGPVRSREVDSILDEAKALINCGYRELILTGIEVSAYNKIPLYELITQVSKINGLERLRLGSLSPNIINEKFLVAVSQLPNFMPHIHLSLQSCCDSVLAAMKRPYRKKDIIERVAAIRKYIPNCIISADIIVGFPGESESDFLETVTVLQELKIFHVHSFPYSERKGTPAASMPNSVPKTIRSERNAHLIMACGKIKESILESMLGKSTSVLVEKISNGYAVGHSNEFIEVSIHDLNYEIGDIIEVKIISHDRATLKATAQ